MKQNAYNPYLPSWEYVPDGEPRVFGNRLYIYGSHDRSDGEDYCLNDYVCWSAPVEDLSDWQKHGVIYRAVQDPRNKDGKMHMCAPDCVQGKDGRFYLYYQLHALQCTCVAVAERPEGPFEYYGAVQHPDGTPWGEKKGDTFAFDPAVLVDDDGKAYIYAGFSTERFIRFVFRMRGNKIDGSVCVELMDDMKTLAGPERPIAPGGKLAKGTSFAGHGFYEASSIRRVGSRYYYVYSSELSHELCYAVSDHPDRDFAFGGTIVSIADIGYQGNTVPLNYTGNTHGGMVEVNGQWYIFYHRQTNKRKCNRQGCAEKITILPDGSIPQVEVTSCGLNAGPLPGTGTYEARIACNLSGKDGIISTENARKKDKNNIYPYFTQTGEDREENGDQYIANMKDGSWCGFKYFRFNGNESGIRASFKGDAEGVLTVSTKQGGEPAASIMVQPSADWREGEAALKTEGGIYPLYFIFEGKGSMDLMAFTVF